MNKQQAASSGISFSGLLTLVFIAAKLWDRIDWPWWAVFSPLWLPLALILGFLAGFVGIVFIAGLISGVIKGVARRLRGRRDDNL